MKQIRRTFPPSIFQLNQIIAPLAPPPDIIKPVNIKPAPIMEPIVEPIIFTEQRIHLLSPLLEETIVLQDIIIEKPIQPVIIAPDTIHRETEYY